MNMNNEIQSITLLNGAYPDKLKNIYDSPKKIYAKGNIELLKKKSVAIVGCRDCSTYGKMVSQKLAYILAKQGVCIISRLSQRNR